MLALCLGGAASAGAEPPVPERLEPMESAWAARDESGSIRRLVEWGEEAMRRNPNDFEVAWRMARAHAWLSVTQENRTLKKALAVKAIEWAERASRLEPARVEGHYFTATAIGEYARTIGILNAVLEGVGGKFETSAQRAYEIDRDYDAGGSMVALGRYYYVLPWPKRDLERSCRYLEELRTRHPQRLIGRVFLAETYYDLGRKDEAQRELEYVLKTEPVFGFAPSEGKELARERIREWFPSSPTLLRSQGPRSGDDHEAGESRNRS